METSVPDKKRIAVIGGGIAGLTAALCLSDLGDLGELDITLFEQKEYFGGNLATRNENYGVKRGELTTVKDARKKVESELARVETELGGIHGELEDVGDGQDDVKSRLEKAQRELEGKKSKLKTVQSELEADPRSERGVFVEPTAGDSDLDVYPHMYQSWYKNFWSLQESIALDLNKNFSPFHTVHQLRL